MRHFAAWVTHMTYMSLHARREYLLRIKPRYLKTKDKVEKTRILDEFCEATGLHRKYTIDCLSAKNDIFWKERKPRSARKPIYGNDFVCALKQIWEILDYPCGMRLKPILPEMVRILSAKGELRVSDSVAAQLTTISESTIDVKLARCKKDIRRKIQGQTKPGSLLKSQIPIRTSSWEETHTGYCELDTVAHCGASGAGDFAVTLNLTDILTQWSEQETSLGKAEARIIQSLDRIRGRLPFELNAIDPDNGGEFINWQLWRYCDKRGISFTRGRPYKKNDNAHIEQKNWTHVRKVYGYARIEDEKIVDLMNDLNRHELRLYKNFFQPTIKLIEKRRVGEHGEHIKRIYDEPKTPYQRTLLNPEMVEEKKRRLREVYASLNPAELRRTIIQKLAVISKLTVAQMLTGK